MPSQVGIVVAAGRCLQTVKVRISKQKWNSHIRKDYTIHKTLLCDDYLNACVLGDVVRIESGLRTSRTKRHVVDEVVSPMRTGTERIQPEGIVGWLKRREEKRAVKLLKMLGVEVAGVGEGGVVGEVLGGKVYGVRVRTQGEVVDKGRWKGLWKGVERKKERLGDKWIEGKGLPVKEAPKVEGSEAPQVEATAA